MFHHLLQRLLLPLVTLRQVTPSSLNHHPLNLFHFPLRLMFHHLPQHLLSLVHLYRQVLNQSYHKEVARSELHTSATTLSRHLDCPLNRVAYYTDTRYQRAVFVFKLLRPVRRTFQHHSFLVMFKTIVSFDLACFSPYPKDICLITFLIRTRTGYNYSLILLACKEVILCTLAASFFFVFCFSDLHCEKSSAIRYLINVVKRMKCSYANARYFKDLSDVLQIGCLPV